MGLVSVSVSISRSPDRELLIYLVPSLLSKPPLRCPTTHCYDVRHLPVLSLTFSSYFFHLCSPSCLLFSFFIQNGIIKDSTPDTEVSLNYFPLFSSYVKKDILSFLCLTFPSTTSLKLNIYMKRKKTQFFKLLNLGNDKSKHLSTKE